MRQHERVEVLLASPAHNVFRVRTATLHYGYEEV